MTIESSPIPGMQILTQDESGDEEGKEASEESEYATDDDYEDESDWGEVKTRTFSDKFYNEIHVSRDCTMLYFYVSKAYKGCNSNLVGI